MGWGGGVEQGEVVLHPYGPNILLQIGEKGLEGGSSHDQGGK